MVFHDLFSVFYKDKGAESQNLYILYIRSADCNMKIFCSVHQNLCCSFAPVNKPQGDNVCIHNILFNILIVS